MTARGIAIVHKRNKNGISFVQQNNKPGDFEAVRLNFSTKLFVVCSIWKT